MPLAKPLVVFVIYAELMLAIAGNKAPIPWSCTSIASAWHVASTVNVHTVSSCTERYSRNRRGIAGRSVNVIDVRPVPVGIRVVVAHEAVFESRVLAMLYSDHVFQPRLVVPSRVLKRPFLSPARICG